MEEWRRVEEKNSSLNTSFYSTVRKESTGQRSAAGSELVHWIPHNAVQCRKRRGKGVKKEERKMRSSERGVKKQ